MADSDLHREVVRLRQELKIWEDRCSKLAKEKEQCSDSATQLTIRIRELEAEVEHLQSVVQQVCCVSVHILAPCWGGVW